MPSRWITCCWTLAGVALVGGCAQNVDLVETRRATATSVSTEKVSLPEPSVYSENGKTVVRGKVKRQPGQLKVGAGHTHVRLTTPGGTAAEQWVGWNPLYIRFDLPRYSTYAVEYPWILPAGSSVKVWACFDQHNDTGGTPPSTLPTM